MQCCAAVLLCCGTVCCAVLWYGVLCCVVLWNTVMALLCFCTLCRALLWCGVLWCGVHCYIAAFSPLLLLLRIALHRPLVAIGGRQTADVGKQNRRLSARDGAAQRQSQQSGAPHHTRTTPAPHPHHSHTTPTPHPHHSHTHRSHPHHSHTNRNVSALRILTGRLSRGMSL